MYRKGASVVPATLVAGLLFGASAAMAVERTLEFRLVTTTIESRTLDAPNVENQSITQSKAFGVAVFKDGRIASKAFVYVTDSAKDSGTYYGYSTDTFEDGATLTARFTARYSSSQNHGEYTILSGTGAYAGATGTGTFDFVPSPFKNASVFNVKLVIKTP